jgi:PPM family protein phosphatase
MPDALSLPVVEYAHRSDPGRDPDKQINEDACGHHETRAGHLCVVCDGMGGHASGREAAQLALATIFECVEQAAEGTPPPQVLRSAIEEASRRVFGMITSEVALGRPGSTVVAVLVHKGGTEIAHVGDSRAYLVRDGTIERVTRDHSLVQQLVDHGLITSDQASRHPDANRITRALGMAPEVEVELKAEPIHQRAGDCFVLCSDGLSDLVQDTDILAIVQRESPEGAAEKLVDLANARGGHDNVTVFVVRACENAAAAVPPTEPGTETAQMPLAVPQTFVDPSPAVAPPELDATPAPPTVTASGSGKQGPLVALAIALALLAMTLLSAVLIVHLANRNGRRSASVLPPESSAAASAATAPTRESAAPATPLVPGEVVIAAPSASSSGSIPALEPSPVPRRKRRR